ncbi:hypothetical protein I309_06634 [Cryptococcus deuterogattii LA55]|nr:hypothetical protein I309_06634 [Cryptococcus deuterogattii LA55]
MAIRAPGNHSANIKGWLLNSTTSPHTTPPVTMDAFTAIFSILSSSIASSTDAPRNEEAYGSGHGITYSCVIA